MNSTPFIEHSSVSLNSLSFSTGIDTARFEGLSIVQENALKNGRLDTSNKIELSSFHHKKEDGSLSFNDNKLQDRKSTRLNSSHVRISYAVFCLKKKKNKHTNP